MQPSPPGHPMQPAFTPPRPCRSTLPRHHIRWLRGDLALLLSILLPLFLSLHLEVHCCRDGLCPSTPSQGGQGGPEGRPPPTITAEVTQPCIFGAFGAGWRRMSHGRRRQRLSWQQSPDGSAVLKVRGLPQQSLPPTALAALGKCRTWQLS